MGRKSKNKRAANGNLHQQHVGGHYGMNSAFGSVL
jgi:hypothetical protein